MLNRYFTSFIAGRRFSFQYLNILNDYIIQDILHCQAKLITLIVPAVQYVHVWLFLILIRKLKYIFIVFLIRSIIMGYFEVRESVWKNYVVLDREEKSQ